MENWTHNTEVIWDKDKIHPIGMIVNGEKLTMEEYNSRYPLVANQELKEKEKE